MNIYESLQKNGIPAEHIRSQVSLKELTSFRIGGMADCVVSVSGVEELARVLSVVSGEGIPYAILGNGTNMLAPDEGFRGLVIRILNEAPRFNGNTVYCPAGASLYSLAQTALKNGFMGFEGLSGIPGTLGGAVIMNAGAYGYEIKDHILSVDVLDGCGIRTVPVTDGMFSYRHSPFGENGEIVLGASFSLEPDDGQALARMQNFSERRKTSQPLSYPSAGSTFKRPAGAYAAALIDQCGLKGRSVGGAQVSEKHAGFVINTGDATEADVMELIGIVQKEVFEKTGFSLEREVRLFSEITIGSKL